MLRRCVKPPAAIRALRCLGPLNFVHALKRGCGLHSSGMPPKKDKRDDAAAAGGPPVKATKAEKRAVAAVAQQLADTSGDDAGEGKKTKAEVEAFFDKTRVVEFQHRPLLQERKPVRRVLAV